MGLTNYERYCRIRNERKQRALFYSGIAALMVLTAVALCGMWVVVSRAWS